MPVGEPHETPGAADAAQTEPPPSAPSPTSTSAASVPPPSPASPPAAPRWLWLWATPVALPVGLSAWLIGEAAYGLFDTPFEPPPGWNKMDTFEQQMTYLDFVYRTHQPDEIENTIFAFAILGAVSGASMGILGGLVRRSAHACRKAGVIGFLGGGLAGVTGSLVMSRVFFQMLRPDNSLVLPFATHAVIFALIGAVGGLVLGLGLGSRPAAIDGLFGGAFGAVFGTGLAQMIQALGFPLVRNLEPIPRAWEVRLAAYLLATVLAALLAAIAAQSNLRAAHPTTTNPPARARPK